MWDLLRAWIKPVSPALAGRFFTTEPPGKPMLSPSSALKRNYSSSHLVPQGFSELNSKPQRLKFRQPQNAREARSPVPFPSGLRSETWSLVPPCTCSLWLCKMVTPLWFLQWGRFGLHCLSTSCMSGTVPKWHPITKVARVWAQWSGSWFLECQAPWCLELCLAMTDNQGEKD